MILYVSVCMHEVDVSVTVFECFFHTFKDYEPFLKVHVFVTYPSALFTATCLWTPTDYSESLQAIAILILS